MIQGFKEINKQIEHYNNAIYNGDYEGYIGLGMIYDPRYRQFKLNKYINKFDKDINKSMSYYKKAVENGAKHSLLAYGVACAELLRKPKLAACYVWLAFYNETNDRVKDTCLKHYNEYKKYLSLDEQHKIEQIHTYEDIQKYVNEFESFIATDMVDLNDGILKNYAYYHPAEKYPDIQYKPITQPHELELYESPKNKKPLNFLIGSTILLFFMKGGIFVLIVVWILYYLWCAKNNAELDNDPMILAKRKEYKRARCIYPEDPNHPLYKEPFFQDQPEFIPGTPENIAMLERTRRMMEMDRWKNL